jgi:hypothetical protein
MRVGSWQRVTSLRFCRGRYEAFMMEYRDMIKGLLGKLDKSTAFYIFIHNTGSVYKMMQVA